ncbi:Ankyrin repeat-containing protein [Maribacter sedimenticola]|uniref:Ankyrin repeat-containing protein n=2 Tax=Maribacter TaxID=252356 RepID=A0ABY1SKQ7_9FLAO|nr:ankyrin repeat domain-containing protein [Maribacter sedimenticola]SNR71757.1 Ankyrin repeat-containing protein [Maribacter sedimenticola]
MKKSISILMLAGLLSFSVSYANTVKEFSANNEFSAVNDDISPLCKAAMKGDVEQVRSLIAIGNGPNEKSLGMTPAMFAARYNRVEVLKVLLLNGANLNMKSEKGYTAKEYAEMSNAKEVLSIIEENS